MASDDQRQHRGRGVQLNTSNRFTDLSIELDPEEVTEDDLRVRTRYLDDTSRSVISTNTSPDLGFDASINPYRGCEHGCSYCLDGSTVILMGDGTSKPLSQVEVGDEIVGTVRAGHYRRLASTQVLDRWITVKPSYRVTLADGTELIASGDHRFLTERGWKHVVDSPKGQVPRPHLTLNNKLMGWGSCGSTPLRDSDTLPGRLKRHLTGMALKSAADLRVVSIEPHEQSQVLHDITTGTSDFIANGVVSHNCYARPTHEYLGLSAGLDFERVIMVKRDAAALLEEKLRSRAWQPRPLMLSGVTDPYQPIERKLGVTRSVLEVLARYKNPVSLITKNALVTRDLDILSEMASWNGVGVTLSITTLDEELRSRLEPRTATIASRFAAMRALSGAGVPVGVNMAPIIPGLTDHEINDLLAAAADAGATLARYTLLRLHGAVTDLFEKWLEDNAPLRKEKVLNRVREVHGGVLDDKRFGRRMKGSGTYAAQVGDLFRLAKRRARIPDRGITLDASLFRVPGEVRQGSLFDDAVL